MRPWINTPNRKEIKDNIGFVYIIKNIKTLKWYVGKKLFWFKQTKSPLKGKKRKRKGLFESDWREYTGSSNTLNADIAKQGIDNFERRIIKLCKTKTELSYEELKQQVLMNALFDKNCYNQLIRCRIHVKK